MPLQYRITADAFRQKIASVKLNNTDGAATRRLAHKNISETLESSRVTFKDASEDSTAVWATS